MGESAMFSGLDFLRELTTVSVLFRMILAVVCGGLIGIERAHKRRPAGFRTHILICLGAAMTTLTSEYLFLVMHSYTDIARLGAQVIAGVGFIGAGTIIVTRNRRVKGLTTAAGLWVSAIIGLTCGAGYYEAAIYATVLILVAELFFSKLEYRIVKQARDASLYVEYADNLTLDAILQRVRENHADITCMEVSREQKPESPHMCAILSLRLGKKSDCKELTSSLLSIPGVRMIQKL